jgi:hypothetical protein
MEKELSIMAKALLKDKIRRMKGKGLQEREDVQGDESNAHMESMEGERAAALARQKEADTKNAEAQNSSAGLQNDKKISDIVNDVVSEKPKRPVPAFIKKEAAKSIPKKASAPKDPEEGMTADQYMERAHSKAMKGDMKGAYEDSDKMNRADELEGIQEKAKQDVQTYKSKSKIKAYYKKYGKQKEWSDRLR